MKTDKILVVDDDEKIRYAFHTLFKKEGCDTYEAKNGRQALRMFKTRQFQAVFLDIGLPDMDGMKILDQMKKMNHIVPVVIITSMGNQEKATEARGMGAFDYLEKPVPVARLRGVLEKIRLLR